MLLGLRYNIGACDMTYPIDLTVISPGAEVTFRCGGRATVEYIRDGAWNYLKFYGAVGERSWMSDGRYTESGEDDIWDIVSISPPPLTQAERLAEIAKIAKETDRLIERVLLDKDHFDFGGWRARNQSLLALAEGRTP